MNLLAGLEKFGFSGKEDIDITAEKGKAAKKGGPASKAQKPVEEKDLLLDKEMTCPVCGRSFSYKAVKTAKAKKIRSDDDLRPYFQGIDTLKYDVIACPYCGYAALSRYFEHLSPTQIRLVREQVASKFTPQKIQEEATYSYERAIQRYKLALVSAMVKRAKLSEKAYICLKTAWLLRAQLADFKTDTEGQKKQKKEKAQEFVEFYRQAYEGFMKALSSEMPPYCGMDSQTVEFMLANMAMSMHQYDVAMKLTGNLLTSASSSSRIKEKCRDLKDRIIAIRQKEAEKTGGKA